MTCKLELLQIKEKGTNSSCSYKTIMTLISNPYKAISEENMFEIMITHEQKQTSLKIY
jgi:hypothetical protein